MRVSEKISEQEKRWNLALEGSQIGVFDVDLATGHGVASETWRALAGFGFDEFTDSEAEWKARIDPRDWPHVRQANIACIKGEAVKMQAEYRFRADDGRWHWMRSEARVIARDAHGRALRLLGTMTDITPLREALNRVKSREAELERLIASAPVAMTVLALDGTFLMANPAFGLFAGYPEASLIGRKLQDLPMTGERLEDRDEIHQMLAGTLDYYNTEKHYIQPDGTEVFGLMSYTILRGNDGEEPRFICQILDITERKRLDQMRADFVATVSHELRTPLTSINGSLKLVLGLMSKELPTKALHLLTVAHQNCDRLGRLVNDLLDMQKFASGKSTLEMERCEVTQIVRQTLVDNASYGQKFSVRFKPLVSIAQIWSRIDVNRFQQVMANLLSNAAKFSPEGGEVITEVRRTDKMLVVSVTNSGLGIPPEFRDKIFTPFTQASDTSTRDREGSGLGLVISKEIVERMGGEIGYESVPGGSTTFWIKLPLDETEDAASDLDGGADAMSAYAELRKGNL
ncbi:sensor histidine kinase YycG [mine drainage metagenome]|uniref:histidine kinase n=1 Tax=mine drainage metagenome TaxID=410659 RepID=A0A1J5PTK2_9ZZZZ